MPIPTPRDDEDESEFIDRCMADEVMNEDFPDESQRRAVCQSQWDKKDQAMIKQSKYSHILNAVFDTPWAILPSKLQAIVEFIEWKAEGHTFTPEEIDARIGAQSRREAETQGGVLVLPVVGTISQRMNLFSEFSGGTSTEKLSNQINRAAEDNSISHILMDMDTPGGGVYGVSELASSMRKARSKKPITAVANSLSASAGYWIGSQASEFVVTPGGETGSIGVFAAHSDISGLLESVGERVTLISAGKFKTEGNELEPLTDEARGAIQSRVDEYYDMFVKDVAKGRGVSVETVRNGFGQGRVLGAKQAVNEGMADRVAPLDEVIEQLNPRTKSRRNRAERRLRLLEAEHSL